MCLVTTWEEFAVEKVMLKSSQNIATLSGGGGRDKDKILCYNLVVPCLKVATYVGHHIQLNH